MDEANQRSMVTKSSMKPKPLANLTSILRKPNQSNKPSATASGSSIGSTQDPIIVPPDHRFPSKSHRLTPAGDENQIAQTRKHNSQNTRSKTTAAVPFYQTSSLGRENNVKAGSVSHCSSTVDKVKHQGKIAKSCLGKPVDVVKKTPVAPHNISTEMVKEKRKSTDVLLSAQVMKNANSSTDKDKGKENVVPSGYSLAGNANGNTGFRMPISLMKRMDKGKAIAEPVDYFSRKKLKNIMMGFGGPLKGVIIKEREDTVTGSGSVNLAQKEKGNGVSTPICYRTLEKKDQQISCPPVLRTTSNRSGVDETEDVLHSKLQTEPPPNKRKRRCPKKEDDEVYELPKEFVEQQRAYFKEIDDFELQVEEV